MGGAGVVGSHGYRGTLHALRSIGRQEGIRGLYRGLGPTVLSNAPFSGARPGPVSAAHAAQLVWMLPRRGADGPAKACLPVPPLRRAGHPHRQTRPPPAPLSHPATNAPASCPVPPSLPSPPPSAALYYLFYTRLQDKLGPGAARRPGPAVNFFSAVVSAVAATLLTQPADVVRTRIQLGVGLHQAAAAVGAAVPAAAGVAGAPGSMRLAWRIAASQGTRGLLAGAAPRIVKRTLQTALVWTIYEELEPRLSRAGAWAAERLRPAGSRQQAQELRGAAGAAAEGRGVGAGAEGGAAGAASASPQR